MKISDADIERQLRLGEDGGWEFKQIEFAGHQPKSPSRNALADEIAAFANADGGVMLLGVTDAGEVQGMSREQMGTLDRLLTEVCMDSIRPPVFAGIHHREVEAGRAFILVDVPRGDAQHDSPGGSYIRVGGTKRKMTPEQRLRLAQRRSQAGHLPFDKQTVPDTGVNTLDEDLWKPLLSAEGATAPQAALEQLRLLAADHAGVVRATVAGVLLCTRHPEKWLPNATITATLYRGRDRTSAQLDAQVITGPLNRQIEEAVAFVARNMRVAARKVPGRIDMPQYSDRAVFEAVVNAVAHRDYSIRSSSIRISMFEDRLEIQSPGELPNGMTVEAMPSTQSTRNEALTSILGRMTTGDIRGGQSRPYFMEHRGDGVRILLRETRQLCGKEAEYRVIGGRDLCLIVPAASHDNNPESVSVKVLAEGRPLPGADLLVLFPNHTWKHTESGYDGEGRVTLYTTQLPMRVYVAAPRHAPHCEPRWVPDDGPLTVELDALPSGGSAVFREETGHVPPVSGRLNPIRDTHDRTYLYASNIAIDEGKAQPVSFLFGEPLRLTDAEGRECWLRIIDIAGRSALVEYRPIDKPTP